MTSPALITAGKKLLGYFRYRGVEPAVSLVGITATLPKTWTFEKKDQHLDLAFWDDYIAVSGIQAGRTHLDGTEIVFVGYGIQAPEYQWDDFKGVDLKGKLTDDGVANYWIKIGNNSGNKPEGTGTTNGRADQDQRTGTPGPCSSATPRR